MFPCAVNFQLLYNTPLNGDTRISLTFLFWAFGLLLMSTIMSKTEIHIIMDTFYSKILIISIDRCTSQVTMLPLKFLPAKQTHSQRDRMGRLKDA